MKTKQQIDWVEALKDSANDSACVEMTVRRIEEAATGMRENNPASTHAAIRKAEKALIDEVWQ